MEFTSSATSQGNKDLYISTLERKKNKKNKKKRKRDETTWVGERIREVEQKMLEENLSKSLNNLFENLLPDDSTFENKIPATPNDDQIRLQSVEDALTHVDQFVTENEGASAMCEKQTSEQSSTHSDFFFAGEETLPN